MVETVEEILQDLGLRKRGHNIVTNFCGWKTLEEYIDKCPSRELQGYVAASTLTGGRISEVLAYRPEMFTTGYTQSGAPVIKCNGLPVLKKPQSAAPIKRTRTIMIPAKEPLVSHLDHIIGVAKREKRPRLFSWKDRTYVWRLVTKVDPQWWPHRFRTERASQLVAEYGFDVALLMKFFNWDKAEEAVGYVRLSAEDITEKMVKKSQS